MIGYEFTQYPIDSAPPHILTLLHTSSYRKISSDMMKWQVFYILDSILDCDQIEILETELTTVCLTKFHEAVF